MTRKLGQAPKSVTTALTALTVSLIAVAVLAGCGGGDSTPAATSQSFAEVREEARGQTVRWWMYGGDARVNEYVDEHVVPAAETQGVDLVRVPIADTAEAVQRVAAQRRAGKTDGGRVDLIWINGENFASGKEAGLWLDDWSEGLPNSELVDFEDPSINLDLQVPIDGQEAPWSRAALIYAFDPATVPEPPSDFASLLTWARENPGRFTYPAPPDFTGTSFVKQLVIALGEDEAFEYLAELKPLMWSEGSRFPASEAELNELYANGEVDLAMSFNPNFISTAVEKGQFPDSTRPLVLEGGALVNTSYVTVPTDASSSAGARVVADLLLSPELQAIKADPKGLGIPTVLDPARLNDEQRRLFSKVRDNPYLLESFGETVAELPADRVAPLEERWKREILR
jgi:putative spermidine/putrescine transport system substrate-binding protein